MKIERLHHIAIICSDYDRSKKFYTQILGFKMEKEIYRSERQSYKLNLSLNGQYFIELFSFPNPPARLTMPESTGLRHISFGVKDIDSSVEFLNANHVSTEPIRIDEFTEKKYTFFSDPDQLPIEIYEL